MATAYVGTRNMAVRITVVDEARQVVDLSAATVTVLMKVSDDTRSFYPSWSFVTNGSDGLISVPLEDRVFDAERTLKFQVTAEFATSTKIGSVVSVTVKGTL